MGRSQSRTVRTLIRTPSSDNRLINVEKTQSDPNNDRDGLGSTWIQDSTGRVTDQSKDEPAQQQQDENGEESFLFAQQDSIPSNKPKITFSDDAPYYPIEYSCEHIVSLFFGTSQQQSTGEEGTENNNSRNENLPFKGPTTNTSQHGIVLKDLSVPIMLEILLPQTKQGFPLTVESITNNIEAMQWSILNLVANLSGLSRNCNIEIQYDDRNLHNYGLLRRLQQTTITSMSRQLSTSLPYPTGIYVIATNTNDVNWSASCTSELTYKSSFKRCITMESYLSVKYRGSAEESNLVVEYIQSLIHNQIAIDPKQLFAMEVEGLYWVNPSTNPEVEIDIEEPPRDVELTETPTDTPDTAVNTQSNDSRPLNLGTVEVIIPIVTGIFLILLWLAARGYWRTKNRHHKSKTSIIHQASKEVQVNDTSSVTTAPTVTPTSSGPGYMTNSEFESMELGEGLMVTPEKVTPKKRDDSIEIRKSTPVSVDSPERFEMKCDEPRDIRKSTPVSVDSPERSGLIRSSMPISVDSPDRSAAGLPPRPPRRGSRKLRRHRKKKRKKAKKVAALKRVNSRENINEMPIISESEDEESEGESDCTSDDGSSSFDTSSGCLTPARSRSLSRTSSRASSPQLSPQDELLATDVFDHDVEFVIEAPDFPNLLDGAVVKGKNRTARSDVVDELPLRMPYRKSRSDNYNEMEALQDRLSLEIEPRPNQDDSDPEDKSPRRRLPLPWLK